MTRARLHRGASRSAVLALLALLAGVVAGDFVHTDDGCVVERHCRICRVALAAAGAATQGGAPTPVLDPVEAVTPPALRLLLASPPDSDSSRGPPLAV